MTVICPRCGDEVDLPLAPKIDVDGGRLYYTAITSVEHICLQ